MGIWDSLASFTDNHLGKISIITDAATALGIVGTIFFCPPSSVLYGIAVASCSFGLAASGGLTSLWYWREYIKSNEVSDINNQILNELKELKQDVKDIKTELKSSNTVDNKQNETLLKKFETTDQKVDKVEIQLAAQIELESQTYTVMQQNQKNMFDNYKSLKRDVKSLKDNQSKVTNNRNAMFTQPKESTRSVDQAQPTQQFQ